MIGDWVYYTGDEKPLFCEIVALDKRDNMSAFEPIPLTQKMLEKNGFVREGIQRNAVYKDGEVYDLCLYGKLK